jgi:hypothetical protein
VQHGYQAFVATLAEPLEGPSDELDDRDDVLLFEVAAFTPERPVGATSELIVNLDRRIFLDDVVGPEILKIEWRYDEDPELAQHAGFDIMGRGPGLPAGDGMVILESFVATVDTSPILARMRLLTPIHAWVWIESHD